MNKSKKLAIVALFLSYYLVASVIPIEIGLLTSSSLVLGLVFFFINKRLRLLITVGIQVRNIFLMGNMIKTMLPTIVAGFSWGLDDTVMQVSTTASGQVSQTGLILIVLINLYPVIKLIPILVAIPVILYGVISTLFVTLNLAINFTSPYSIYLIYKKLGLWKHITNNTGGRINLETT